MAQSSGVLPASFFAFTSAPLRIKSSASSLLSKRAALCKGVVPKSSFVFTSAPEEISNSTNSLLSNNIAKFRAAVSFSLAFTLTPSFNSCSTASMSLALIALCSGSVLCPHPTSTTAAIVVSRRCFISLQLSVPSWSCPRVCGVGRGFCVRIISGIGLWKMDVYFFQWKVSPSRIRLRFDFRLGTGLAKFFGAFSARCFLISKYFGCSAKLRHSLGSFCTL